jgi:SAM-dependent methyltransferase
MLEDSIEDILERHGYLRDGTTRLWQRPGTKSIAYSDGQEVEERLARNVAGVQDLSVDSPEWDGLIVDWPSEYHFSRLRSNLLKPLPIKAGERVLELGAGCGAITRWLGETGAEVIAVEGSSQRAAIVASRCRDLPNVHVVVQDIHSIPQFEADWVTLIGVLEYARVFGCSADPVAATLIAARDQLAPGGALVLAIENQLGLKYFAGCREDHTGTRFSGIQGSYRENGPVTFGRRELVDRLDACGLFAQRFLLPFPDYKLPIVVVDEFGAADRDIDSAAVIARTMTRDYAGPTLRTFSENLVWSVLERNGLIADLANSFLVVAAKKKESLAVRAPDSSTLAWTYSSERRVPLRVVTRIVREADGLRVRKETSGPEQAIEGGRWRQEVLPVVDYIYGETLGIRLLKFAEAGDERAFFEALLSWLDLLLERSWFLELSPPNVARSWFLDGQSVDLNPRNIIVDPSGSLRVFDQEWHCADPVPLVWIVLRGLLALPSQVFQGSFFHTTSVQDLARDLLARRDLTLMDADIGFACDIEADFQSWVRGVPPEQIRWDERGLAIRGALRESKVYELMQSSQEARVALEIQRDQAVKSVEEVQNFLLRASAEANRLQEHAERIEAELRRSLQEAEHFRKRLEKFESHFVFGTALRLRRYVTSLLIERGQATARLADEKRLRRNRTRPVESHPRPGPERRAKRRLLAIAHANAADSKIGDSIHRVDSDHSSSRPHQLRPRRDIQIPAHD